MFDELSYKKVNYAYQELPHSEDTAPIHPHSQEEERKREFGL
jgi:hypothetical protein